MKQVFTFFILSFWLQLSAQDVEMKLIETLDFKQRNFTDFIGVDTQENVFFTKNQEIIKTDHKSEWSYTSFELGFPTHVSLLNSLEILVFYEQANTFVLLDKFLNETNRIRLNNLNPPQSAKLLTNARNNEVWLVDNFDYKLKYINYQNDIRSSVSINLPEFIQALQANFNNAYLLTENVLYQFDNYGTLLHEMNIKSENISSIILGNRFLILQGKTRSYLYDLNLEKLGSIVFPENNIKDACLKDEKFYIFENGIVTIHQLEITKE